MYPKFRKQLDEAAKRLKVQPPTGFEYEDPKFWKSSSIVPDAVAARLRTQKAWHDSAVGQETFSALLEHFRGKGKKVIEDGDDYIDLLGDLSEFESMLRDATATGDSFRIEASF